MRVRVCVYVRARARVRICLGSAYACVQVCIHICIYVTFSFKVGKEKNAAKKAVEHPKYAVMIVAAIAAPAKPSLSI